LLGYNYWPGFIAIHQTGPEMTLVIVAICSMLVLVIRHLQMPLNAAAHLVVDADKFQHITPVLRDVFHQLPVHW